MAGAQIVFSLSENHLDLRKQSQESAIVVPDLQQGPDSNELHSNNYVSCLSLYLDILSLEVINPET